MVSKTYDISVAQAAPIIPYFGIKIKFNPTFTNAVPMEMTNISVRRFSAIRK